MQLDDEEGSIIAIDPKHLTISPDFADDDEGDHDDDGDQVRDSQTLLLS